ncbi:MAG: hypothetical protein Kow0025_01440 [Thermodesulfovibrionales bacterium]
MRFVIAASLVLFLAGPALAGAGGYCVQCHGSFEMENMGPGPFAGVPRGNGPACPALAAVRREALWAEGELLAAWAAVDAIEARGAVEASPWRRGLAALSAEYAGLEGGALVAGSSSGAVLDLRALGLRASAIRDEAEAAAKGGGGGGSVALGAVLAVLLAAGVIFGLRRFLS